MVVFELTLLRNILGDVILIQGIHFEHDVINCVKKITIEIRYGNNIQKHEET